MTIERGGLLANSRASEVMNVKLIGTKFQFGSHFGPMIQFDLE